MQQTRVCPLAAGNASRNEITSSSSYTCRQTVHNGPEGQTNTISIDANSGARKALHVGGASQLDTLRDADLVARDLAGDDLLSTNQLFRTRQGAASRALQKMQSSTRAPFFLFSVEVMSATHNDRTDWICSFSERGAAEDAKFRSSVAILHTSESQSRGHMSHLDVEM